MRNLTLGLAAVLSGVSSANALPMLGKNKELGMQIFKALDVKAKPCSSFYITKKDTEALCGVYPSKIIEPEDLDAAVLNVEYIISKTSKLVPANKDWGKGTRDCAPCRSYNLKGVMYNIVLDPWIYQMKAATTGGENDGSMDVVITTSIKR